MEFDRGADPVKLITDEYRKLNEQLHADRPDYGTSGHKWASKVFDLLEGDDETILDYGCGKGTLKTILGDVVYEYDPAIPGKDADPEPRDVLVCTDVLEHIEPDLIDKVISHIYSKTKRLAFLVIATRPAKKFLADGRNAHLIIENKDWWLERLSKYFSGFSAGDDKEFVFIGAPIRELSLIPGKGAIPDDIRNEQMRSCLARGLKRLELPEPGFDNGRTAILACYGPSLKYMVAKIKLLMEHDDVDLITCSGAHDWLLDQGIVPFAHSDIDGRVHKAQLLQRPDHRVKYWMGSVCHPTYFDKLQEHGVDVSFFHIQNSEVTAKWVEENDPEGWLLTGGVTIGNRLLGLLYHLGYRKVHVFGMDCSFGIEGERHAGPHTGKTQRIMRVRCGDVWFDTSPQMVTAARDMIEMLPVLNPLGFDVTFHGNGLLQAMIAQATGLTGNE